MWSCLASAGLTFGPRCPLRRDLPLSQSLEITLSPLVSPGYNGPAAHADAPGNGRYLREYLRAASARSRALGTVRISRAVK